MPGAVLSVVGELFKEVYEPKIQEQYNTDCPFLKNLDEVEGKMLSATEYQIAVKYAASQGVGAGGGDTPELPAAGYARNKQSRLAVCRQYGSIQVDNILLLEPSGAMLADVLTDEMSSMANAYLLDINRQLTADNSGLGYMAMCSAVTATTVCQLASSMTTHMHQFQVGMKVQIGSVSDSTLAIASTLIISDVDIDNSTITLDAAVTTSAANAVFRYGAVAWSTTGSAPTSYEVTSIFKIVNTTGILQAIDPTSAGMAFWKAIVATANGSTLTENMLEKRINAVKTYGGGETSLIYSGLAQRRKYIETLRGDRQYIMKGQDANGYLGGWTDIAYQSGNRKIPWAVDNGIRDDVVLGLDWKRLFKKVLAWMQWLDRDGNKLHVVYGTNALKDAYEGGMFSYYNIGTDNRRAHFQIKNLDYAE